jgi:hypothetical protein
LADGERALFGAMNDLLDGARFCATGMGSRFSARFDIQNRFNASLLRMLALAKEIL